MSILALLLGPFGWAGAESISSSKGEIHPGESISIDAQFDPVSNATAYYATFEIVDSSGNVLVIWTEQLTDDGRASSENRLPRDTLEGECTAFVSSWDGNDTSVQSTTFNVVPLPPPPKPPFPLYWVLSGIGLVIVGVALASMEWTRYSFVILLLPLFSRMMKHEVLDNKTRYAIHGIIIENPGIHYNAIQRAFGLTNGAAAYHLRVLEREDFIRSVRDGRLRRFYSRTTKVPEDKRPTPEEIKERVLELVVARPGMSQREIVMELGMERDTVGYHLRGLVAEGRLESRSRGKYTIYFPRRLT